MRTAEGKTSSKGKIKQSTTTREVRKSPELTTRMQFHALHNTGEQLRWATAVEITSKRLDRMVGR